MMQHWINAHDPSFSGPEAIHADVTTTNAINAAQGLGPTTAISKTVLDGSSAQAALAADQIASNLYQELGPTNQAFIDAFVEAPVTGMATLWDMARIRADFYPQNGQDSLSSFNAYIQSGGQCPLFRLVSSSSNKFAKPAQPLADVLDVLKVVLFESLSMDAKEREGFMTHVDMALQNGEAGEPVDMDLYVMELVATETSTQFRVNGAKVAVDITKRPLHSNTMDYSISGSAYELVFDFAGPWTPEWAENVATKHFASITQWTKASSSY